MNLIGEILNIISSKIRKLELLDVDGADEKLAINKEIRILEDRRDRFEKQISIAKENRKTFDTLIGAEYVVSLDSRVLQDDMAVLADFNKKTIVKVDEDGNEIDEYTKSPHFRRADIKNSIISFDYYSPENDDGTSSILKSNIPGLQAFQQEGGNIGTAHIKGGGEVTGSISMRLSGVCGYEKKVGEHQYKLSNEGNPNFTANQTYEIQQQFRYGYEASLFTEKVVSQIAEETITHKNKGFTKSQIFSDVINSDLMSVLKFKWKNNHSTKENNVNSKQVQNIKTGVFQNFVDNLLNELVESGKLEIVKASDVANVGGGTVDVTKTRPHCWIERKWYGHRSKKCIDQTYIVKEWKDGLTQKDIQATLSITANTSEVMSADVMTPFYFTSTFESNNKSEGEKE